MAYLRRLGPGRLHGYNGAMEQTLKATVRYDGTDFAGWQVQPGQRTVQGVIEDALATMAGQPVRIAGAGRTDSGVHALGQVFSCRWSGAKSVEELRRSLSQLLNPEIRVEEVSVVPDDFHAQHSALGKRYAYAVCHAREQDPFLAQYGWTVPWEVNLAYVADLAQRVVGEHDFAGFCSSGSSVETTVRTIQSAEVREGPIVGPTDAAGAWRLELHGNGFLYKMVRNIVGTIADIARGQTPEARLNELLNAPAPFHGYTAPAKGLFLVEVEYPH